MVECNTTSLFLHLIDNLAKSVSSSPSIGGKDAAPSPAKLANSAHQLNLAMAEPGDIE